MAEFENFRKYYQDHMPQIYGYIYLRARQNRALAEDLVSEIFLKAIEHFNQFSEKKGSFRSWIFQIAKNHLKDHFKARKNDENISIEKLINTLKPDVDTQKSAQLEIEKESLKNAINSLKDDKQEVIALRYFSGYSYTEIANLTGENENKIRVKTHRTLKELKNKLESLKFETNEE